MPAGRVRRDDGAPDTQGGDGDKQAGAPGKRIRVGDRTLHRPQLWQKRWSSDTGDLPLIQGLVVSVPLLDKVEIETSWRLKLDAGLKASAGPVTLRDISVSGPDSLFGSQPLHGTAKLHLPYVVRGDATGSEGLAGEVTHMYSGVQGRVRGIVHASADGAMNGAQEAQVDVTYDPDDESLSFQLRDTVLAQLALTANLDAELVAELQFDMDDLLDRDERRKKGKGLPVPIPAGLGAAPGAVFPRIPKPDDPLPDSSPWPIPNPTLPKEGKGIPKWRKVWSKRFHLGDWHWAKGWRYSDVVYSWNSKREGDTTLGHQPNGVDGLASDDLLRDLVEAAGGGEGGEAHDPREGAGASAPPPADTEALDAAKRATQAGEQAEHDVREEGALLGDTGGIDDEEIRIEQSAVDADREELGALRRLYLGAIGLFEDDAGMRAMALGELDRVVQRAGALEQQVAQHRKREQEHGRTQAPHELVEKGKEQPVHERWREAKDAVGGIVELMRWIGRGKVVHLSGGAKFDRAAFAAAWDSRERQYIAGAFRRACPHSHEWIPTNMMPDVVERAATVDRFLEGATWVDVQHALRSPTSSLIFRPERRREHAKDEQGATRWVLQGHTGAVFFPNILFTDPDRQRRDARGRRPALMGNQQLGGQQDFHDELRACFRAADHIGQCLDSIADVVRLWVLDGSVIGEAHPFLSTDRLGNEPIAYPAFASTQAGRYGQVFRAITDVRWKFS